MCSRYLIFLKMGYLQTCHLLLACYLSSIDHSCCRLHPYYRVLEAQLCLFKLIPQIIFFFINKMNHRIQDPSSTSAPNQKNIQQSSTANEKLKANNQQQGETTRQKLLRLRVELQKIFQKMQEPHQQDQEGLTKEIRRINAEVLKIRQARLQASEKIHQKTEKTRHNYQRKAIRNQRDNTQIQNIGSGNWREQTPKKTKGLFSFIKKSLGFELKKQQSEPKFDQDLSSLLSEEDEGEDKT